MSNRGWIGVDLDGTLAHYSGWVSETHIGAPVPAMVDRVKAWLAEDKEVRVFTARINGALRALDGSIPVLAAIEDWCKEHIGQVLTVTATKDYKMVELWDDRAVQIVPNTGIRADGHA